MNHTKITGVMVIIVLTLVSATTLSLTPMLLQIQQQHSVQAAMSSVGSSSLYSGPRASIAVSGSNNVYLTWWDNKTGSWEVFSKASTDNGKTFGNDAVVIKSVGSSPVKGLKAPSSNTTSVDTIVAAPSGGSNNEYVVW